MQDLHLHLGIGQLPPTGGRQQRGADPAEHGQQHVSVMDKPHGTGIMDGEAAADAAAAIHVADFITQVVAVSSADWLIRLVSPAHTGWWRITAEVVFLQRFH